MDNQAYELSALRELVNHRGVVELLDLLAQEPQTVDELRGALGMRRQGAARVLRVLAAHGLVATDGVGSWDESLQFQGPIRLTESGWRTVEMLSDFAVWVELYEQSDAARDR
ncbi:winged helix-turn-helix domain-containing protein [Nocardia sp. NBC_01327]|uniref:winged helix-turn-helix domain-containing protein n=1 Tax=Nocardia sp. NBC_01327 TaxID=2903593 RepID=UPI002E103427|nr:winged helix-turn-helix domain-containing protein [Nocardia sp. NBC_01327]